MELGFTTTPMETSTRKYLIFNIYIVQNRGEFVNGKRAGRAKMKFSDRSEYFGQFLDDEIYGNGSYTDKYGNLFT